MPPDQHVRTLIETDLETNFLIEAGAGSGKTTALVGRMLALVKSGVAVDRIAAVTFTRKAAAELRERFQARVEEELRTLPAASEEAGRLEIAIRDLERGFVGTVHAFCARLLRERPLEAGIDPDFEELMEAEHERYLQEFWRIELDRRAAAEDPKLGAVLQAGIQPTELIDAFRTVVENLDVRFPFDFVEAPPEVEVARVRSRLNALHDRALALLPETKPDKGWGKLQKSVRNLRYARTRPDWESDPEFLAALVELVSTTPEATLNRWGSSSQAKAKAKELKLGFQEFVADPSVQAVADQWLAQRYAPAMDFLLSMATTFADQRRRTGRLSFQDLLSLTAGLLRTHPGARRDLGRRYSRLLIDEFQDTDPIQAEIAFLLASEPDPGGEGDSSWMKVIPRPGALFMVGDPKQSIYRFRRADIAVYNSVRTRMEVVGRVERLLANFRSLHSVAGLVNDVFSEAFPAEPTTEQAAYAPLLSQRSHEGIKTHGVFTYRLEGGWRFTEQTARDEANRLAAWIRRRVDSGERASGDFLILTDRKRHLHLYAHALEAQNLSVDVAGARIEIERGLGELLVVLRALIDPADPVKTVAVLTGLFFGLDHDALLDHRLAGGAFDCRTAEQGPLGPTRDALATLGRWWEDSLAAPSDVFVTRLVDELGVIPDAAASELGGIRTGALLYALDTIRTAAAAGDTSLVGAVEALSTGIEWGDAETPLEPGRDDSVRVMNIHKAKGLEANVVVLAGPGAEWTSAAELHVARSEAGEAVGFLEIGVGGWARRRIARPLGWSAFEVAEEAFLEAQQVRLRYVAATRAAEELVVGTRDRGSDSPWKMLEPWVVAHATPLENFEPSESRPTEEPAVSPESLVERIRATTSARAALRAKSYRVRSVTALAKDVEPEVDVPAEGDVDAPAEQTADAGQPRGFEWGSVAHAALAAAARGVDGPEWDALCRGLLIDFDRPLDSDGEPLELGDLRALVTNVRQSDVWKRSRDADVRLTEVPFAVPLKGNPEDLLEGVIDLAFTGERGWVVVDYKTDVGDDPGFGDRAIAYRAQVDAYAEAWTTLTGEPVMERILFFTTQGREESW